MRYRYMNEYGARGKHAFMHRFIKTPFDKPFGDDDGPVGGGGGNWWEQPQWDDFAAVPDLENWRFALPAWGAELAADQGFDTTGLWTKGTGWTVSGGKASKAAGTGSDLQITTPPSLTRGNLYVMTYTISGYSAGSLQGYASGGSGAVRSSNGTFTEYITPTGVNALVGWFASSSFVGDIDNWSLREVVLTRGGAALGANLGASGYTMSVLSGPGASTATESPAGTLILNCDGTNAAVGDKSFVATIGRRYRVMASAAAGSNGTLFVGTSLGGSQNIIGSLTAATFGSFEFTATATTHWIRWQRGAAGTATISAIEIRELPATGAFPKRAATFSEYYSFTATSTTQRSYVDSTGTRRNDLAANEPRRDWRTGKQSWRLEDARTNICLQSRDFTTTWSPGATSVVADQATSPDGSSNADKVTADGTASPHQVSQASITGTAAAYTYSVYAKMGTNRYIQLRFNIALGGGAAANFDLQAGVAQASSAPPTSQSITAVGNGWYRCTMTSTLLAASGAVACYAVSGLSAIPAESNSLGGDWYLWGAQLELGAFASDPIPTTSAAVTRAIETARFSPLVEAVMQRAASSVVVRGKHDYAAAAFFGQMLGLAGGASMLASEGSATVLAAYNGTSTVLTTLGSGTVTAAFGAAASFDSGGRSISGNGSSPNSDTSTIGDRSKAYLARREAAGYGPGNYKLGGAISPERLSNAKLQALAVA